MNVMEGVELTETRLHALTSERDGLSCSQKGDYVRYASDCLSVYGKILRIEKLVDDNGIDISTEGSSNKKWKQDFLNRIKIIILSTKVETCNTQDSFELWDCHRHLLRAWTDLQGEKVAKGSGTEVTKEKSIEKETEDTGFKKKQHTYVNKLNQLANGIADEKQKELFKKILAQAKDNSQGNCQQTDKNM